MQDPTQQNVIITIIGIITVLLFLGILFIVMLVYYSNKKKQIEKDKIAMQQQFSEQILQSQLEVEEQTRHRISQELHDNIAALASVININLGLLERIREFDLQKELIEETKHIAKDLILDVKHLSISLDTNRISDATLPEALGKEIRRLQKQDRFKIEFSVNGNEAVISENKRIIIFRICQELLHNIVKHAKPSLVIVDVTYSNSDLHIMINDNGIGFDIEAAKKKIKGSGLINLYNRAIILGGSLYLKSDAQFGTHCTLRVPITA
jgi:signal transduction histidine kinase